MRVCAWCGMELAPDAELFSLGAKVRPEVDLEGPAGTVIPLYVDPGKTILGIVSGSDSEAKKQGNDILFVICSESCGKSLRKALQRQVALFDDINPT